MNNRAVSVVLGRRMPSFKFSFSDLWEQKRRSAWFPQARSCSASWQTPSFLGTFFPAVSCAAGHHLLGHHQRVSLPVWQAVSFSLHRGKGQPGPTEIHSGPVPDPQLCTTLVPQTPSDLRQLSLSDDLAPGEQVPHDSRPPHTWCARQQVVFRAGSHRCQRTIPCFFAGLLSTGKRWITCGFDEDICWTRAPCRTQPGATNLWCDSELPVCRHPLWALLWNTARDPSRHSSTGRWEGTSESWWKLSRN